jgi:hypothetical protein
MQSLPTTTAQTAPAIPGGSPRLTFIGFDLARNPRARDALEAMARASGGRVAMAEDGAALTAALTAGVVARPWGAAPSGGPAPLTPSLLPWAIGLGLVNVALAGGLLLARLRRQRHRAARSHHRAARVALAVVAGSALVPLVPSSGRSTIPQPVGPAAAAPLYANDPVLLVHGLLGSAASFGALSTGLTGRGWVELPVMRLAPDATTPECIVEVVTPPNRATTAIPTCTPWEAVARRTLTAAAGRGRPFVRVEFADNSGLTFAEQGALVGRATAQVRAVTGAATVRLVGHSMGGLASRAYLQGRDHRGDVSQLITVATPHAGSLLPYYYRVRDKRLPDLGPPLPVGDFLSHLVANTFTDASGQDVFMWLPATLNNPNGVRRLIGTSGPFPGLPLFRTLHDPDRRREAYAVALRELALMPRVAQFGGAAADRLARTLQEAELPPGDVQALMAVVEEAPPAINRRYTYDVTAAGRAHNLVARHARRLDVVRQGEAFGAASLALANLAATETLSDVLVGALLLHALNVDAAHERLVQLRRVLVDTPIRGLRLDPALRQGLEDVELELEVGRSEIGALVVEVQRQRARIAGSALTLGAELSRITLEVAANSSNPPIAKFASKYAGKAGPWIFFPVLTWEVLTGISEQWAMAQDASAMATIADRMAQAQAPEGATARLIAYGQYAFFGRMHDALRTNLARFKDALSPGAINRDVAKDYLDHMQSMSLLGALPTSCRGATTAQAVVAAVLGSLPLLIDPHDPRIQRLAPDSPELRRLNAGASPEFGALPTPIAYHSVVAEAAVPSIADACAQDGARLLVPVFTEMVNREWKASGGPAPSFDPAILGFSPALFAQRSDLVVPVASQMLRIASVGWPVQAAHTLVSANHFTVTGTPELLELVDIPMARVTTNSTGPVGGAERVLLVMDLSGSMNERGKLTDAKSALRAAVRSVSAGTSLGMLGFGWGCETRLLAPFSAATDGLLAMADGLQATGSTPLVQAITHAAELVKDSPMPDRTVVVVLTDGEANCGSSPAEAAEAARRLGAVLGLIGGPVAVGRN